MLGYCPSSWKKTRLADGQGKCFNNYIDTASNLMLCDCTVPPCNNGSVKLVGDSFIENGKYVQYCHGGAWHSLCAGGGSWTRVEANVVCRQLGHSGQGMLVLFIYNYSCPCRSQ